MRKIDIQVNKAVINSFSCEIDSDDKITVGATLNLFSGDKKVSSFNAGSENWRDVPLQLSPKMADAFREISRDIERQMVVALNREMKTLPQAQAV